MSEPAGDDQPVLSIRYMDCPDPGTLLAFTFGISTVANPLWGGLRPELAICVDSTDPRWAWALADIGDRVRTTSVFLPGDTIEIGEPISDESPDGLRSCCGTSCSPTTRRSCRSTGTRSCWCRPCRCTAPSSSTSAGRPIGPSGCASFLGELAELGVAVTDVRREPIH